VKILLVIADSKQSGCWVRVQHLAKSLNKNTGVVLVPAFPFALPWRLNLLASLPYYFFRVLVSDADVIIGNKPHFNVVLPLLFAKYLQKKKIVIDIDDADFLYVSGLPSRIIAALQRPFPRYFDLVTYHSHELRDFIVREFAVPEHKLYRLKQGVDLTMFAPLCGKVEKGSFFFMGTLDVASCLSAILLAVHRVQQRCDVSLIIAGDGPRASSYKALTAGMNLKKIIFLGAVPLTGLRRHIAAADVCLAYYDETEANRYRSSMKLREYLAMGKKVASNNVGDMVEFKDFTYQSSGGIDGFADAMCRALAAADGREGRAPEFIRAHYDWDTIGRDFFETLRRKFAP
jgi:glycosyltransferase involved in cell wall biosynthesis